MFFELKWGFFRHLNWKTSCIPIPLLIWAGRNSFPVNFFHQKVLNCALASLKHSTFMKNTVLFSSCHHDFIPVKQYFFSTASCLKLRLSVSTEVLTKCSVLFKTEVKCQELYSAERLIVCYIKAAFFWLFFTFSIVEDAGIRIVMGYF